MGFSKCTYRNCQVKSDKLLSTHMFHYPVFDKVRCHEWLTNACKLEYLNLKVSQLKNRVVCQHHFTDDNFMNYLKNKLKHYAVPTLNGPYCDAGPDANNEENYKITSLMLEDIDQDVGFCKKRSAESYSKRYAEFLTNSEMNIDYLCNNVKDESNVSQDLHTEYLTTLAKIMENKKSLTQESNVRRQSILKPKTPCKNSKSEPTLRKATSKPGIRIISEKNISNAVKVTGDLLPVSPRSHVINPKKKQDVQVAEKIIFENYNQYHAVIANNSIAPVMLDNLPIEFNTQPDVNAQILPEQLEVNAQVLQNKLEESKSEQSLKEKLEQIEFELTEIHKEPSSTKSHEPQTPTLKHRTPVYIQKPSIKKRITTKQSLPKNYLLKSKTLEPKNDILAEALKKSEVQVPIKKACKSSAKEKIYEKVDIQDSALPIVPIEISPTAKSKENSNEKVASSYLQDSALSVLQENIMNYLDSKINVMQKLLSARIDQNTQKLNELKNVSSKPESEQPSKKSAGTQVAKTGQSHKKQLFHEISQYLSSEAKNLIYEELFINPHIEKATQEQSGIAKKRRKRQ